MKYLNWLAIIPVILGVLFFRNLVKNREAPQKVAEPEAAVVVRTQTVTNVALPRALKGFGTVVSAREWTAVPQIGGKVVHVHPNLRTGEQVSEGSVLFTIETVDQGLEQSRIQADQQALQAEITQLKERKKQLHLRRRFRTKRQPNQTKRRNSYPIRMSRSVNSRRRRFLSSIFRETTWLHSSTG